MFELLPARRSARRRCVDGGLCYLQAAARARDAHGVRGRPGQVGLHVPVGLRAADLPSRAGVSRARRVVGRRAVRFARLRAARRGLGGLAAGVPPLRQGGSLLDALGAQHARLPSVHMAPVRRAGSADAGVGARWHKLPAERHRGIPVRRREPAWPACRACGSQRRDCGTPVLSARAPSPAEPASHTVAACVTYGCRRGSRGAPASRNVGRRACT
eukprot:scaffold56005_cov74-Phaeocystis_antarctica.AAC.1